MIRKLRIKSVASTMGSLLIAFIIILTMLNFFMRARSKEDTERFLEKIVMSDGLSPKDKPFALDENFPPQDDGFLAQDEPPSSSMFFVKLDSDGNQLETNISQIADFDEEKAMGYVDYVLEKNTSKGNIGDFQYLSADKPYGRIIAFAERGVENKMLQELFTLSVWVAAISSIFLFCISLLLTQWSLRPVVKTFEKQKQFISDASHELKTPLTIIYTNAEVLENEIGANQRIESIKTQTNRMNLLIRDLLNIARMDEIKDTIVLAPFNLSHATLSVVLEYESRIFEENRNLDYQIDENIYSLANESQIKQVVSIFLDNAIRYSPPKGGITVKLFLKNEKVALLVRNSGNGIEKNELEHIFERFYRIDQSRGRETGGYGLGLAIAKSIVEANKGKIFVKSQLQEWTEFGIILPSYNK